MRTTRSFGWVALAALALAGCGGGGDGGSTRRVFGETQFVGGRAAQSWATLNEGLVTEVGMTVPRAMLASPATGAGPAGAFLSLDLPSVARAGTMFDHFELHWNPAGHPPEQFAAAHFDLHAYAIPEAQVRAIAPPDTVAPLAERIPAGYEYPGTNAAVPEMGVHALNPADLVDPFTAVLTMVFWGGNLIGIEPMFTQERVNNRESFTLNIPVPANFGRNTRYPRQFRATYNEGTDSYDFVFSDFVPVVV